MQKIHLRLLVIVGLAFLLPGRSPGQSANCTTSIVNNTYQGSANVNYGGLNNAFNAQNRTSLTIGQLAVGDYIGQDNTGVLGYWGRYLMPPLPPQVLATEGDLPDRIVVRWAPDPLSSSADAGFKIYRNGAYLATVDKNTKNFTDFNVLAGEFYTYEVSGTNQFGEGSKGKALGFLNPNGTVTGQVRSTTGNPVPGVAVELTPTLGKALLFTGDDQVFADSTGKLLFNQWTVSFWVKIGDGNNRSGILDFGNKLDKNWWFLTTAGPKKGVAVGITGAELSYEFPTDKANNWHYVAATHNGASLLLYIDGDLVTTQVAPYSAAAVQKLYMGSLSDNTKYFTGGLDEVRLFSRQLSQTELQAVMHQTVPTNAPGLAAYWKFDEGTGSKSFSLAGQRHKTYFCGAEWSDDRPEVKNAGVTDASGFYKIEGINYGSGSTFSASAKKSFYFNQSLEFNRVNKQYAELPDFDVPDSSTIALWIKPFDLNSYQQIIHKTTGGSGHIFDLNFHDGQIELAIGAIKRKYGAIPPGFHHLAMTMIHAGSSLKVDFYLDGQLKGSNDYNYAQHNWAGKPWRVGVYEFDNGALKDYFSGLIDEIAFFKKALTPTEIQTYYNTGTDVASRHLAHYFNFNEGSGTEVADMGMALGKPGILKGATWATASAKPRTAPHEFSPDARLVTLNPSNTSTDGVDFTDQSTIPVSGFVRYEGTDCFVDSMEILVNGESYAPPVYTDSVGKFILDLEPGTSAKLTPVYGKKNKHSFYPAFWEIKNISTPVAGILFRDQTTRTLEGQIAGGNCRQSILGTGQKMKVKVASENGCFEKTMELAQANNADGRYKFTGLPPMEMTVAIVEHSDPTIYNAFQLVGGKPFDLTEENDTIHFTYYAPPQVEIAPLPENACKKAILAQYARYQVEIKVKESYAGGVCYVDTAQLSISNEFSEGRPQVDTLMTKGKFTLKFMAGLPNIISPFLKTLTVTADVDGRKATGTAQAVITGERPRVSTFTTTTPEIPLMILRDPPGDGSYASWQKGVSRCFNMSFDIGRNDGKGVVEKVSLGPTIKTGFGIGVIKELEIDIVAEEEGDFLWSKSQNKSYSQEVCVTTNEILSTSDEESVVGEMGGDVFLGGALNIIYGVTDKLLFDDKTCLFYRDTSIIMHPDRFKTTYIYSEHFILNDVIPALTVLGETKARDNWKNILALNDKLKKEATFEKNISFDAGTVYEYSQEIDTLKSGSFTTNVTFDKDFVAQGGAFFDDVGGSVGYHLVVHTDSITVRDSSSQKTITTGYVLKDNDSGDNFTVDVKKDKEYGTPVFVVKAGESSCPHEPGTQPREEVDLTVNTTSIANVAANDAAVFVFTLGNKSQTEETRTYNFTLVNNSNPDGAVVKVNGMPLDRVPFELPFGKGQVVTVTVERGPVAYTYQDLKIAIQSQCEDDLSDSLFSKSVLLDVYFIEPCSPVDIGSPQQDWVLTPAQGGILQVTLNSYNEADPDLELIRLQYRRTQGDGAWITVVEIPKGDLIPVSKTLPWNTKYLKDGLYEIRAATQCKGSLPEGISHVIKGKIERQNPELLGTPEPADGVLSPGDEISITFNEPIRCDKIIAADLSNLNNVGLYNTETGDLVDAKISCSGDKIILVPNVPIQTIENKLLRVKIKGIADLAGNESNLVEWEFFVDKNPLHWVGSGVKVVKYPDQAVIVTRQIENQGGQTLDWSLGQQLPKWVRISPKAGQLAPGAAETIRFEFGNDMVLGNYLDTLKMNGTFGTEPLVVDARVICRPPLWEVDPAQFDFSMTLSVQLDIAGKISQDEEDIIAAFVDGQLRGTAKVQYDPIVKRHLAYLTVYHDQPDKGVLTFQIWDASDCRLFGKTIETFPFKFNESIGLPNDPQTIHTENLLLRTIPLNGGWNWISFNLRLPDARPTAALSSLNNPNNGLLKSQTQFSTYTPGIGWVGSLAALGNPPMYQLRVPGNDSIDLLGEPILPSSLPIAVQSGWNWVGYLPNFPLPVNQALVSLAPIATNGDLVKSQTQFAQYLPGLGWVGNLDYMEAPKGYLLKMAKAGVLTYPDPTHFKGAPEGKGPAEPVSSYWMVDPTRFEFSMTLVGIFADNGQNATLATHELGVFVGNELRGSAQALYIEPLQSWMFFLTMYANTTGEPLHFKLYDSANQQEYALHEGLTFVANGQEGTVQAPVPFTVASSGVTSASLAGLSALEVFPNPFSTQAMLRFHAVRSEEVVVTITDLMGRLQKRATIKAFSGINNWVWNGHSDGGAALPAGLYTVRVETAEMVLTQKVVRRE